VPKQRWEVLLTVTELTKQVEEGIEDRRVFRFKMLPFIALEGGHPWASNPPAGTRITPFTETSYALAWAINRELLEASHLARTWAPNGNRWVLGSESTPSYPILGDVDGRALQMLPLIENARVAHPSAISLSLQLRQGRVLADDDILSIATRVASRSMPLLVAAGNWGIYGEGSLSPLAKLPWTIAVGATKDETGTERLPESSVGVKRSDLQSGVTVVAYGEDLFAPGKFGTSFAVPRALAQALTLTAFVLQIRQIDFTRRTGLLGGIPLLLSFTVDTGFAGYDPRPSLPLPMIPRAGVDQSAVLEVIEILQHFGISPDIEPHSEIIRRMLVDSARPMPGLDSSEVGAGFVCTEGTLEYLRNFNGRKFVELFAAGASLDESALVRLSRIRLADSATLEALDEVARRSSLRYSIDFRTGQIHASMRDPELEKGAHGFTKEPSRYSWPPPL
jgi:hypothetical protein